MKMGGEAAEERHNRCFLWNHECLRPARCSDTRFLRWVAGGRDLSLLSHPAVWQVRVAQRSQAAW